MIVEIKDLKWYIASTVNNDSYKLRYYFNGEYADNITEIFQDSKALINLGDIVTNLDTQTVTVYIEKVLPVINIKEVIKECNSHNALCEGCPFYKLRGMQCAFYTKFPCQWEDALKDCGYKLEV